MEDDLPESQLIVVRNDFSNLTLSLRSICPVGLLFCQENHWLKFQQAHCYNIGCRLDADYSILDDLVAPGDRSGKMTMMRDPSLQLYNGRAAEVM